MRLIRWKRIGQSGRELAAAILFSFIIHGLLIAAALVYNLAASPRISVPISYQVMLVNAPTAVEPAQPQEAPLPPPQPEEAPAQKKTAPKAPAAAKPPTAAKSAMPDLGAPKAAQKKIQQPEVTAEKEKPAALTGQPSPAGTALQKEAVAVSAGAQNQLPGLAGYFPFVKKRIEPNWKPPQGVREARSKVLFRILRSGRVTDVKLQEPSGNFYFDQAAIRAILSVGSFPPLPEVYPREYLEISVDLIPKE